MDVGLLSFIMPIVHKEWALTNSQTGLISSISTIGMICGGFFFGYLADRIGRKDTLMLSLLTFSIGNFVLAFAQGFDSFLIIRFFVGMGLGGELPVAATYVSDLYSGTKRSRMLILADSFWALGWLVASFLSFALNGVLSWRGLLIVTAISAFFAIVVRKQVPEIKQPAKKERHFAIGKFLNFKTMMLWLAWFMVMFSYYGMFMWLPGIMTSKGNSVVDSFGYSVIIIVAQLPGYFTAAWLTKKINLRYIFAIYMIGTAIGAVLFGQAQTPVATVICGCILSFFNLGAYGTIIAITPSIYEPAIRGTMTGLAEGIGRIGAVIGPLLVGVLIDQKIGINVIFVIFMVSLIIGAAAMLLIPTVKKQASINED
ncbi:MFS transporter [Lactobacillus sp. ESL0679]|uniref:MFS transporter n=1 Tax=unclassified Lactobacillus TaxID=2620435 RepID=UPI0023F9C04D|nr:MULTISPECIES: MFS transporter [unclassified Lactobacillus]MDF7683008.1 MFS transporter [Lactobacillus sp. ESL0679]WEV37897.1 MFS transporter [Lactobacillus sp. ESL0677]